MVGWEEGGNTRIRKSVKTVSTKFTDDGFKLQVGYRKEAIEAWWIWHSGHIEGSHDYLTEQTCVND